MSGHQANDPTDPMADPAAAAADAFPPREGASEPPSVRARREQRSHRVLMLIVRSLFLVLLVSVALLTVASEERQPADFDLATAIGLFIAATAVGVIVLAVDAMLPNKRLTTMVGVYLGIVAALLVALALGALIDMVAAAWEIDTGRMAVYIGLSKVIIAIVLCYLSVSVVLTTKDDFRLVIPYVEFARQVRGTRPLVLDTSVLIDGRIDNLGNTGFFEAPIIVPQFVIDELQQLADSGEKLKRARGRRGMAVLSRLQENPYLDVSIDQAEVPGRSVDHMLLGLAREQDLRIVTTDFNLAKVAQIQGLTVLNINDLANTLKPQAIPGETLSIEIVKPGEAPTQGVGYLPDGTMVVVEDAADSIGRTVTLTVTNSLQTSAGRMIFGRLAEAPSSDSGRPHGTDDAGAAIEGGAAGALPNPAPDGSPGAGPVKPPRRPATRSEPSRRNPRR